MDGVPLQANESSQADGGKLAVSQAGAAPLKVPISGSRIPSTWLPTDVV